jgi:hypothetical protein
MASAASKVGTLSLIPVALPTAVAGMAFVAWKIKWMRLLRSFFYGRGRYRRIVLLLFALFNMKNMPFVWTVSPTYVFPNAVSNALIRSIWLTYLGFIVRAE